MLFKLLNSIVIDQNYIMDQSIFFSELNEQKNSLKRPEKKIPIFLEMDILLGEI